MRLHLRTDRVRLYHGDSSDAASVIAPESIDAIVTDPPAGISFMNKSWDGDRGGRDAWIAWLAAILRSAMTLLKPGGHALVWALPRTSHWTATAVEDAGFEIRDVVQHLFGSGFPKSLDVSKAIDEAAGMERKIVGSRAGQPGYSLAPSQGGVFSIGGSGDPARECAITAPATPAVAQWSGWGTALKPAAEHWILARKPLVSRAVDVVSVVESELRNRGVGEIRWSVSASDAARQSSITSFASIPPRQAEGTSAASADGSETASDAPPIARSSGRTGRSGQTLTPDGQGNTPGRPTASSAKKSLRRTAAAAPAAESESPHSSPSTTSTAEGQGTDERRTGRSTPPCDVPDSRPGIESYAGIATGLIGSLAHVRIETDSSGCFVWPDGLPRSVAAQQLTVASNVQRFGTGAINVDGCRIGGAWENDSAGSGSGKSGQVYGVGLGVVVATPHQLGRWPAHLVLSHLPECEEIGEATEDRLMLESGTGTAALVEGWGGVGGGSRVIGAQRVTRTVYRCAPGCAVAMLDEQSGVGSSSDHVRHCSAKPTTVAKGREYDRASPGVEDAGGASRFFATFHPDATRFKYTAKPARSEKDAGLDHLPLRTGGEATDREDGSAGLSNPRAGAGRGGGVRNHHPTVKSIELMRWLCRLITPPGGTVLDLFAGSGTTGIAALRDGFRFVGVEQDAAFVDVAAGRLAHVECVAPPPLADDKIEAAEPAQPSLFGRTA